MDIKRMERQMIIKKNIFPILLLVGLISFNVFSLYENGRPLHLVTNLVSWLLIMSQFKK